MARCVFHLAVSLAASSAILAILQPATLASPLLWAVLVLTSLGLMAVGTTIAAISKTQTTAGLLTLAYMLGTGIVFYLGTQYSAFDWVRRAMFERYSFALIFLSIKNRANLVVAPGFATLAVLITLWGSAAAFLFRRSGWR